MTTRFPNIDAAYIIEARRLRRLEEIVTLLNRAQPISFDERRDAANMIDLILSEAIYLDEDNFS